MEPGHNILAFFSMLSACTLKRFQQEPFNNDYTLSYTYIFISNIGKGLLLRQCGLIANIKLHFYMSCCGPACSPDT